MKMKPFLFLFIVLTICFSNKCKAIEILVSNQELTIQSTNIYPDSLTKDTSRIENHKVRPKRRIVAAFLCLTLGPFGMHRLYLGTEARVAAAYTLTLGGGIGIVPVIDLFSIVFTRDISKFKDNDRFIMWAK